MVPRKRASEPNEFGGEWSRRKLECVEGYLKAYLDVFRNMEWADLWYIDAFSGSGIQVMPQSTQQNAAIGEAMLFDLQLDEFIEGSSLRALRLAEENESSGKRGFDHFVFIELDKGKLDSLEEKVSSDYPTQLRKCVFIQGDVNDELPRVLRSISWGSGRAVTFIDPFATQFRWSAMESFRDTCSDVWLLFPIHGITRMMPVGKPPNQSLAATLDEIFGDPTWRDAYHEPSAIQLDIFGNASSGLYRDSGIKGLLGYYRGRLETVFHGVLDPVELRTSKNAPLFALYSLVANDSEAAIRVSQRIAQHLLDELRS